MEGVPSLLGHSPLKCHQGENTSACQEPKAVFCQSVVFGSLAPRNVLLVKALVVGAY